VTGRLDAVDAGESPPILASNPSTRFCNDIRISGSPMNDRTGERTLHFAA